MKLGVIVLAAGNSRRFGANKLLYEIDGKKMYQWSFETVQELCENIGADEQTRMGEAMVSITVTVVTQYEEVADMAQNRGFSVFYNMHPENGISSSLKLGLTANLDADACLFMVADQPWLSARTLKSLIEIWCASGKGIACASVNGIPGNPCIFSAVYFEELLALTGDRGGKKIVHAHRNDLALLEVENEKELQDIDIPLKTR